ncbi:tRNA modification GTPase TrmE [Marinitoga piezophila KA3]|uniref:tRNA modification GTPase MnmE n=1 Tax=Marinitoga piezophila (strain DSM 14283 / JCM 11233 / KA3) TaxID=443254 RepID=H2J4J4_MARPK|nr:MULTISPECIES: tRNA uridine-5-carboxymethylaminomethyl(34) synthesis GTPase MnmE [Marinitoga]AEX85936.1 tRNA modification GTPase TrmE [Marinitoga piezophila KA3]APT76364.1 tRNA modification GTPase [Marinitoga sp. 1137]NUU98041.1 tRNA modification GTPase [Marinitoga sp. 1138]
MIFDTIAAISSPPGTGAISVIRLSGDKVIKVIKELFNMENPKPKYMYYSFLKQNNELIDEVTWVYHKGPKSYTGEDMLEIFGHGGILLTKKILNIILSLGVREALPGEFSKRAVMNKKMDLIKAEAINEMIHANSEYSLKAAASQIDGKLSKDIKELKSVLYNIAARIEVEMDYPDDFEVDNFEFLDSLNSVKEKLNYLYENADNGIAAVEGIKMAIVGKPNAGKSTLLNALLRKDRAIVTDIPGTTRDTIEENLNIRGIYIKVIDTAGIRETGDIVEKIGVERSLKAIEESKMILFVLDNSTGIEDYDLEIFEKIKNYTDKKIVIVINKSDIKNTDKIDIPWKEYKIVKISAANGEIQELENLIYNELKDVVITKEYTLTNERQKNAVKKAIDSIENALNGIHLGLTNDAIMFDVRKSIESLNELTGEDYTETLLDNIFGNFCVGK